MGFEWVFNWFLMGSDGFWIGFEGFLMGLSRFFFV